ncbi:globin domain-containing protein [Oceaniglobus roseus]|uniref:globin domain-containing protein n=1 Tax=Oceaniglobus roseus TaxID=1737570 RepID=UPI000C7F1CE0|nr:globin domain-containing protein [Kandeliimicrobium roseum]
MTPQQISVIRASFARIYRRKARITRAFYDILFARAPHLRPLFAEEMVPQHEKLANMLAFTVRHLSDAPLLKSTLSELGLRHVAYGAEPQHFVLVGTALMEALKAETPGGLSPAEEEAWSAAIFALSGLMISAMEVSEA